MNDETKPADLKDEDVEAAHGGFGQSFGNSDLTFKARQRDSLQNDIEASITSKDTKG